MAEKFYLNATMDYKGDSYFPVMDKEINLEDYCYTQENIVKIFDYDENNILCIGSTKVFVVNKINMSIEKTINTTHDTNGVCYDYESTVLYYICKTDMALYKYDFSTDENVKMDVDFGSIRLSSSYTKLMDKTGNCIYIVNDNRLIKISVEDRTVTSTLLFNSIYTANDRCVYALSSSSSTLTVSIVNKEEFTKESFNVTLNVEAKSQNCLCSNKFIFFVGPSNRLIIIDLENRCLINKSNSKYVSILLYKENIIGIRDNTIYKIVVSSESCDKKIATVNDNVDLTGISSCYCIDDTFYIAFQNGIYNTITEYKKSDHYKKLEV
ncbi:hypothetical protein KQI77_02495 [Clostridium sp. MSJ-8]|uniref:hypothetical protein n=1 Tax=Clostridium sp. MSJ-8 TaxID=2841510 RepID=UPI001C0F2B79|nr:hypothetical protein [Clostridium sp. MSJ-8]MBU5487031.1 hypothetical protein [Clostridium sp. MSJ-8]